MALSIAKGLKNKYKIEVVGRAQDSVENFEKRLGCEIEKYPLPRSQRPRWERIHKVKIPNQTKINKYNQCTRKS